MLFSVHVIVRVAVSVSLAQNQQSGAVVMFMLWFMGVGVLMVGALLVVNSKVLLTLLYPSYTYILQ